MEIYDKLLLEPSARQFCRFIGRLAGRSSPGLLLAAAELSSCAAAGNVCVELSQLAGEKSSASRVGESVCFPALALWLEDLRDSGVVGGEGEFSPLILDSDNRLYLQRYWQYQDGVAIYINASLRQPITVDYGLLSDGLSRLFGPGDKGRYDWQKIAAFAALNRRFCVITGGPGTGKTTTVAKILALLFEQAGDTNIRIALAAPTGKAVSRLQESIAQVNAGLDCTEDIKDQLPDKASTLHRLLGAGSEGGFRFNRRNPLDYDVVVIDEASMVALPMMARLMAAMRPGARLILLGDRDQLASVEPGAVLGDICRRQRLADYSDDFCLKLHDCDAGQLAPANAAHPESLHDSIVELRDSFRFKGDSGIGLLSQAVRGADSAKEIDEFFQNKYTDACWRLVSSSAEIDNLIGTRINDIVAALINVGSLAEALVGLSRLKFLCPLRHGLFGVEAVNGIVEEHLRRMGLISAGQDNYRGRPLMIVQNDYERNLFNGDIGVMWPDADGNGQLRAFFQKADGIHSVSPALLPSHTTVYAMTVHKSQGSEYDEVIVVLPDEPAPVITRELIYTALTRARGKVEVWGLEEVLLAGMARRVDRQSGLPVRLWGTD